MKTKILLFSILLSFNLFAQEDEVDCAPSPLSNDLEKLATSFQVPNCNTRKNIQAANRGDFSKLCQTCIPQFEEAVKTISDIKVTQRPIDLQKILADELKRSLSGQILSIVNLRSGSPQADFTKAVSACSLHDFSEKIKKKNCGGPQFNDLSNKISEELGHLLASPPVFDNRGILNRENSKGSCNISDSEILRAKSTILEESLDENIVEEILALKADDSILFETTLGEIGQRKNIPLISALRSHPLFSKMMTPPKDLQTFLKSLKRPVKAEQLQAAMYTNKATNEALVNQITKKCSDAFSTYEKYACNADIKSGKIKLNSLKDAGVFMNPPETIAKPYLDLSQSNELQSNQDLANICHIRDESSSALDFNKSLEGMTGWMLDEDKSSTFEKYRTDKYENEIGQLRSTLCDIRRGKAKCEEGKYQCNLYKYIEEEKKEGTLKSRLAKSSDKNVNSLLRSMIGSPNLSELSVATRTTLINEGILPRNDKGDFVEQPVVPERQPEYINKMAGNPTSGQSVPTAIQAPVAGNAPSLAKAPIVPQSIAGSSSVSSSATSTASAAVTPTTEEPTDATMEGIDNEILRRLSQGSKSGEAKKSVTKDEARAAVRDVYKAQARPLSSALESTTADRVMKSYNNPTQPNANGPEQKATLTPDETPKEKWEKEQKLRALSGMAGAQASAVAAGALGATRGPASEASVTLDDKKLSTVSLNVAEDKVKLNLSDVLSDKILKNDSEGQLLKVFIENKKDFILQINNVSFKVKFDKASGQYKLAFTQGDFSEADRLKPQLEKFFSRINRPVK